MCQCDCGNIRNIKRQSLLSGNSKSCGCSPHIGNTKHGMCYTPEYVAWRAMRQRCYMPSNNRYKLYSERGTQVCDRYKISFEGFLEDIGYRPSDEHSVDRIDNDLNYSCGKCDECLKMGWKMNIRWATEEVQGRNKITNKWYEYNGKKLIQADWAKELKVSKKTLNKYLRKHTFEEAFVFYSGGGYPSRKPHTLRRKSL